MMKRIMTGLVAISAAFVLNACSASCEDACANQAEVCKDLLGGEEGAKTFQTSCEAGCKSDAVAEGEEKCKNADDIFDCVASAETCGAITTCMEKCEN